MEIMVEAELSQHLSEQNLPHPQDIPKPETEQKALIQKAITQTFLSTSHLANLLPTGSVLAFKHLSPFVTNQGKCDAASQSMIVGLVALCGVSCFLLCFTDSFRDKNGNVCYGFATFHSLQNIDGSAKIPPELAAKYWLQFIDFVHAFMSIVVKPAYSNVFHRCLLSVF